MLGDRKVRQEALIYSFSLEEHVPQSHLLRAVDRFVDLNGIQEKLRPCYSETGRPSIDPELMIRMLLIGYCLGIRSERRLCEEVHLNLAYRWFCHLGLDGSVPDYSTFSKNRHGRLRLGGPNGAKDEFHLEPAPARETHPDPAAYRPSVTPGADFAPASETDNHRLLQHYRSPGAIPNRWLPRTDLSYSGQA